jgi:hypothetical protein
MIFYNIGPRLESFAREEHSNFLVARNISDEAFLMTSPCVTRAVFVAEGDAGDVAHIWASQVAPVNKKQFFLYF